MSDQRANCLDRESGVSGLANTGYWIHVRKARLVESFTTAFEFCEFRQLTEGSQRKVL